jgi:sugar O-acyltransferase (sialic acid O-acetyltransferase NeuD family)
VTSTVHVPPGSALVILGAGRQAVETAGYCGELGYDVAYFVEEQPPLDDVVKGELPRDQARFRAPIVGFAEYSAAAAELPAITAVGGAAVRRRFVDLSACEDFLTLVSSSAWLAGDVVCGPGTTVAPRACLNRFVRIGAHVLVNVAAVLSHDVSVGDFVTISPGCLIGGGVAIEDDAFLGIGSVVRDEIRIGRGATVGAGAVVVTDVPAGSTVVGVPARPIESHQ